MPNSNNSFNLLPPPPQYSATGDPLSNLSAIQTRVDSLSQLLSNSVNANTPLSKPESDSITADLNSAIHHIVINAAALISATSHSNQTSNSDDFAIVELDVMELTAEPHSHTCAICGKGFRRDANLRMHMRAHGDQFKTLESLSKPQNLRVSDNGRKTRFSCPYGGCNRNKRHKDFRPLKSVVCAKNHFKRSHCPKKFSCCRCNSKCFSLLSDLKFHMKHCSVVKIEDDDKLKLNDDGGSNSRLNVVDDGDENGGFQFDGVKDERQLNLWSSIEELIHF